MIRADVDLNHQQRSSAPASPQRLCPVCGRHSDAFLAFGRKRRPDAQCPQCGSLERHRLVWRYLELCTDLFDGRARRVLHVAPETCFAPRFSRAFGDGYVTADWSRPGIMVRMDVCAMPHPEGTFDVAYCSDVLEHVIDDRRAMVEFQRVLKSGGWAVLLVPVTVPHTVEDPGVTDPAERRRRFGQEDHVRRYGPDFADRLREAGFRVRCIRPRDFLGDDEITRIAAGDRVIFHCTRPAVPADSS